MSAVPDKISQIGSSAWDVCATIDAIPAAISARPYATALPAASRARTITINAFMFQSVANVSATVSYFAALFVSRSSGVQVPDQTVVVSMEELLSLSRTRYFQLDAAVC